MLTQDDLKQLRSIVREENEAVEQRLNAKRVTSEEAFGGMLHEILNVVSDHHTKLEHRVARIETHLGLPESQ